jgi:hypothetical protein
MYKQAPFKYRCHQTALDFATVLNLKGLIGTAVEIGTHRGDFAAMFLKRWDGERLYCVDPWELQPPEFISQVPYLLGGDKSIGAGSISRKRKADYEKARQVLEPFGSEAILYKGTSKDFSLEATAPTYDFVYIDGDHLQIADDLQRFWPLVKAGGILAGHDWLLPTQQSNPDNPGLWGRVIQPAVGIFAAHVDVDIWLVVEDGEQPWSFFLEKPK